MEFTFKRYEDENLIRLVVDGEEIEKSYIFPGTVEISDPKISQKIISLNFEEIILGFSDIGFFEKVQFFPLYRLSSNLNLNVKFRIHQESSSCNLQLFIEPDFEHWNKPYSLNEYKKLFADKITTEESLKDLSFYPNNPSDYLPVFAQNQHQMEFEGVIYFDNQPIKNLIDIFTDAVKTVDLNVNNVLLKKYVSESLSSSFIFPEKVKTFCEQYLLYFAQFLQDLGINATSNLKEEAGKVLFSVTPTDDAEALDKIREALAVYLNLPSSPIEYNESFAGMRLQQQVENLQHAQRMAVREVRTSEKELRLAQTVIEHQDKIILQKDSIIDQKDKTIEKLSSKSIMTDSLENKEKLYEGLEFVPSEALKKYLGVIFQPVSFFKQLGTNLLGKEKETISILNSGEIDEDKTIE